MGMLPNVFMCELQSVGVFFALRMAQMALVSDYVCFWKTLIHFSIYCKMSRYGNSFFRSVPLIINTSVENYTLQNGTEQDTSRYQYRDKIQRN